MLTCKSLEKSSPKVVQVQTRPPVPGQLVEIVFVGVPIWSFSLIICLLLQIIHNRTLSTNHDFNYYHDLYIFISAHTCLNMIAMI